MDSTGKKFQFCKNLFNTEVVIVFKIILKTNKSQDYVGMTNDYVSQIEKYLDKRNGTTQFGRLVV